MTRPVTRPDAFALLMELATWNCYDTRTGEKWQERNGVRLTSDGAAAPVAASTPSEAPECSG